MTIKNGTQQLLKTKSDPSLVASSVIENLPHMIRKVSILGTPLKN